MPSITKLPDSTVPRSEEDLLYSTLLALGGGADGVTKLPDSAVPRSNQDLLYSIMLAAQGISGGGSSLSISSQAQAEAGADNTTAMSPLRVDQRLALTFGTPTAVGKALLNLTNPGAISFLRLNADNTASALSAADMRAALALGTIATQPASNVAITGGTFAGLSVQAGSGSGRISINHDINGVLLGSTTSTIQFYDTYLSRGGAAHVLMMGASGASPATQCFKAASGVGTNIGGAKLELCAGQSTGNATPARLALRGTTQGASGSTAQTYADVLSVLNSHYIEIGDGVTIDGTGSGFRLGNTGASLLGLWGAGPVAQFNTSGGGGISVGGSGNPVLDDSTFVGSTGSTAYTVNDLISALKLCGVLAA